MYLNSRPPSVQKRVFEAAERSVDELKAIIEAENVPITILNALGQTLAHIAAKAGNVDVIKYVLKKEPRMVNKKDDENCSILHLASLKGALEVVKYLVNVQKADISILGGYYRDRTAFHAAVEFNHLDVVKYFVEERDVDFNMPNPKQTIPPLFLAVKRRNWDVIRYLIEEKHADVRKVNANQETILFVIVREDFLDLMKYLLDEKGFDLSVDWKNFYGETPVHVAVKFGRMRMLEYLVDEKFANLNIQKRTDRRAPLHYAAARDRFEMCKFLIERGADPRLKDTYGHTAADKANDGRLIDYLEDAAETRRPPRSAASPYSFSLEPVPLPLPFRFAHQGSINHLSESVGRVAENRSIPRDDALNLSYFHGFLFLAKSLMKSVNGGRSAENSILLSPPSSIVRSNMSSIAIDVISAKTNFS